MEQSLLQFLSCDIVGKLEKWIFKREFELGSMFNKQFYETDL